MTFIRTAFVFPGQGSQHPGMLDAAPENDALERLLDAAEALSGLELRSIARLGQAEDLADTRVAQPLLYLTDWAWAVALLESQIVPDLIAGHSLGELAALAVGGVVSVEAGLELVIERSKLMAATVAAAPGTMAAVLGLSAGVVADTVATIDDVWVANDNSPGQVVISGSHEAVGTATLQLTNIGARRVVPLKVAGPFQSPMMEPARAAFAEILVGTEFKNATIPVLQNTDPSPATDGRAIRERLIGQITAPVRWTETMRALSEDGPTVVIEAGPGSVLGGLTRDYASLTAVSVEESGIERVVEEVS
ncbi:MAG: ACP S-malonyltransferase [Coriobacteriia bacterium]|nr:ACP S-malonyltransferase [Coriobacteriia bacterium]